MNEPSKKTDSHAVIEKWVKDRSGVPAVVKGTETTGNGAGLLRILFPEHASKKNILLIPISWDTFFETFDENNLVFLYQEKTADGQLSRFFKFIRKNTK